MFPTKNKAFTLVEIMVVIAIIGLLSSIIVVSVSRVREKARLAAGISFSKSIERSMGAYSPGMWNFEGNLSDNSGYNSNGIFRGGAGETAAGKYSSDTPSNQGLSFSFDGVDDYIAVNKTPSFVPGLADFSIAFWIKRTGSANYNYIYGQYPHAGRNGVFAIIEDSSSPYNLRLLARDSAGTYFWVLFSYRLTKDRWTHVAVTRSDVSSYTLYIDGSQKQKIGPSGGNGNLDWAWTDGPYIGYINGGPFVEGYMDDVRFYNYALSSSQAQHLYANGLNNIIRD